MGSWNKTCGMSQLPIHAGESVYCFILEKQQHHVRSSCFSLWKPVPLPYVTQYDEYGDGENSDWVLPILMKEIYPKLGETTDTSADQDATLDQTLEEQEFYNLVHKGKCMARVHSVVKAQLDLVMMKKDLVDELIDKLVFERYVHDGTGAQRKYKANDLLAEIPSYIQELKRTCAVAVEHAGPKIDAIQSDLDPTARGVLLSAFKFRALRETREGWWKKDQLLPGWLSWEPSVDDAAVCNFPWLLLRALDAGDDKLCEQLLERHLVACFVTYVFETTRKLWTPGCHDGNSINLHEVRDTYKLVHDVIGNYIGPSKVIE